MNIHVIPKEESIVRMSVQEKNLKRDVVDEVILISIIGPFGEIFENWF